MEITRTSQLTGKTHTREINITQEQYDRWRNAGPDDEYRFIQVAFPHLSANDREFLKTGSTPVEWDAAFADPDDPQCNGECLTGYDVGVESGEIAYAHPFCPLHGDGCPGYEDGGTDGAGRPMCEHCGVYREDHP